MVERLSCVQTWKHAVSGGRRLVGYEYSDGTLSMQNRPVLESQERKEDQNYETENSETIVYDTPAAAAD